VLGQHHVEVNTDSSADFSFYLVEDMGCMTTHEGDLGNLIMKVILQRLSYDLPVFLEWSAFDEKTNTILLTHHGVVDPKHCGDMKKCRWTPSPERWDFSGNGLSIEYCSKKGQVTLGSLIDDSDGWKLIISKGECVEIPPKPCFAPQFYFRPSIDVRDYIKKILEEGVTHHVCLVYGDYAKHLELIGKYLGLRRVTV
jgi:L-arabinose isomerase